MANHNAGHLESGDINDIAPPVEDESVLEAWFGAAREAIENEGHVQRHDWGGCKAGMPAMLDHFVEYSLLDPPRSQSEIAGWKKGMQTFMEEYGTDKKLMQDTIQSMKTKGWMITGPFSIIKTARHMRSKRKEDDQAQKFRDSMKKYEVE